MKEQIPEYIHTEFDILSADIAMAFHQSLISVQKNPGNEQAEKDFADSMHRICIMSLKLAYMHGVRETYKQLNDANEVIKFYGTYINWAAQIGNQYNTTGIFKIDRTTNQLVMECGERAREYMKKWCLESDKANREK